MIKNIHFIFCFLISTFCFSEKIKYPEGFEPQEQKQRISFTENKGQVSDQYYKPRPDVLFGGNANGMAFHLRNNGISYQLNRIDSWKEEVDNRTQEKRKSIDQTTVYRLDINWKGCNPSSQIKKEKALAGYSNYYLEVCPNGVQEVKSYSEITYQNIYKGIDLKWYEKDGNLKYDYNVAVGADYKQIQLEIKGAEKISLNNKAELVIKTPLGEIIEQAPLVKQGNKILRSKWVVKNNLISFEIENLNSNEEFVIDPMVRVWGTYYGGTGDEFGWACATDATGNVYVTGYTEFSTGTVIATVGAHQTISGGGKDAHLVKFNSSGIRQWGTFYGGAGDDAGRSCTADATGNIYLAGYTSSNTSTLMATVGAHQPIFGGGLEDAFLVKFNSSGVRQWGTYYGDIYVDEIFSCTTDATGNVYLCGDTELSTGTVIATVGSHQPSLGGGFDAFLAKFDPSGIRQWGTYYGGAGSDYAYSCVMDATGNLYMAGISSTNTGTVIATAGVHQPVHGGGGGDAYLVKFNSAGVRQWGTYYGGNQSDQGFSCATDATGNVYLAGLSNSTTGTVIATAGAHQTVQGGGGYDAFLVKFNLSGVRQWGTYYGGNAAEYEYSLATDPTGNVYMAGYTASNTGTVIATAGAFQPVHGTGFYDAYLVKFDPLGVRQWGTYYGGTMGDYGFSCATDANGNIYFAGYSGSNTGTVIATAGVHQSVYGGGNNDDFLVKFADCSVPASPTGSNVVSCANNSATLTATSGTATTNWFATPSSTTVLGTGSAYITPTLSAGTYTYYAEAFTCVSSVTRTAITLTVNPSPTVTAVSSSSLICIGESATLTASGANTYTFNPGGPGVSIVVSPTVTVNYTVTGTGANGCTNSAVITQSVDACTGLSSVALGKKEINIYPNPFNNKITIVSNIVKQPVLIFNALGSLIYKTEIENGKTEIDLSKENDGIYFIRVGTEIKKIIKE